MSFQLSSEISIQNNLNKAEMSFKWNNIGHTLELGLPTPMFIK